MPDKSDVLSRTDGMFYSSPPMAFDPVSGYRWKTGNTRLLSLIKGELIFDSRVTFNNWGHHCSYNYVPKKSSRNVFRIVVLGDSFTNGICMPRTWTETLQELLRSHPEQGREIEVYAFPVDGGGILNWYHVFMKQILPTFDFDALILGDTVNDGGNKFITAHSSQKGCYIGFLDYAQRPQTQADFKRIFPTMGRYYDVIPESMMEEMIRRARRRGAGPKIKPSDYLKVDETALLAKTARGHKTSLTAWYGERRLGMLREIVAACRKRKATVVYYSMPRRVDLLLHKKRQALLKQQACAESLAHQLGVDYFDGYSAFGGVTAGDIVDLCWLKYDGHWTLPGANLFANGMASWIIQKELLAKSPRLT